MVTAKQTWIGFVILFLLALLLVVAAIYWHRVTGANLSHLLADGSFGIPIGQGC